MCIDRQVDFCWPGGYVDRMGYDLGLTRAGLPATARLLAHSRATGMLVVHTREGHAPDLSDLPANNCWRSAQIATDTFVHTTMREANDRGYECLVLSDCTGATDPANHEAALNMVTMHGGVFGAVADHTSVIAAVSRDSY